MYIGYLFKKTLQYKTVYYKMDMVESSDKMWSTEEENGKPLQYFCLENPMNSMKRQNDRILNRLNGNVFE